MATGEVAGAGLLGGPAGRDRRPSTSRSPQWALSWILVVSAAVTLVFVAFPDGYESQRGLEVQIAAALLVIAAFTAFVVPRLPSSWGLDVTVVAVGVVAAAAAAQLPQAEGQLLIGFGLVAVGVFVAFYRSTRRALLLMTLLLLLWGAGTVVDPRLSSPVIGISVAVVVLGVTWLVSRLVQRLHEMALHDGLTGVLNRHGLDLLVDPVVAAARRAHLGVVVGIVDLDRFKEFNDTFGHVEGDRLLTAVAEAWDDAVRDSDLVARFGGDEFVVILVGATVDDARTLDERARTSFAERSGERWRDDWAAGFTALEPHERVTQAIARADAELLDAKRGRP